MENHAAEPDLADIQACATRHDEAAFARVVERNDGYVLALSRSRVSEVPFPRHGRATGSPRPSVASTGEQPIRVAVHREGRDIVLALPNGPLRFQIKRFPEGGTLWLHRSQRQMHVQQSADAAPAHWHLDLKSLR